MSHHRRPAPTDLADLETRLATGLVPVQADDAFVETVHRRLAVDDPRPMEIAWRPPSARQHILFTLAAAGGSLVTLGVALLLWFYRRSHLRPAA